MMDLAPGQKVTFSEPADVGGSYEPFQRRNLLRIASGLGVMYSDMTGDMKQTSYGSQRAGMLQFRRRITAMQNHIMIFQFCRPVARRWLREGVMAQAIEGLSPSDYLDRQRELERIKWIPPRWDWIDPQKDLEAEVLAVNNLFKSRSDVIESTGLDPEEVDARIKADQDREAEQEIVRPAPTPSPTSPPSGGTPGSPDLGEPPTPSPNPSPNARMNLRIENHIPGGRKKVTRVTQYDDRGRIMEFESEDA